MGSVLPETTKERVKPSLLSAPVTCGGKLKFAVAAPAGRPLGQVISGYVPIARPEPSTAIVGVPVVKVTVPVTLSGDTVVLGVTLPKLNSLVAVLSSKVRLEQVHCFVLSVIATPRVRPVCTSTALLAHEPPTTPTSLPPVTVVAPL